MSAIIGRHPAFARRGGFASPHRTTQSLYTSIRIVKEAANAALERRGALRLPCHWRDGATVRRPISEQPKA